MIDKRSFYLCDVFTSKPLAGNQLAVVASLGHSDESLLSISREFGFSETIFIPADWYTRVDRNALELPARIFTPASELSFGGHPIIGLSSVLAIESLHRGTLLNKVSIDLAGGRCEVDIKAQSPNTARCTLTLPESPSVHDLELSKQTLANLIGLSAEDIDEGLCPCSGVICGSGFTFIPLKTTDAVKRVEIDKNIWKERLSETSFPNIYVFSPSGNETYDVRMFGFGIGQNEDSGTGAAAAGLAFLLSAVRNGRVSGKVTQGYHLGRGSNIYFEADASGASGAVMISGDCSLFAKGVLA